MANGYISKSYVRELQRVVRQPSHDLRALTKVWPKVQARSNRRLRKLVRAIREDDPMRWDVDLLQSIQRASDETLHTQALAYALNPKQNHGFGIDVLIALLEKIAEIHGRAGAARVLNSIRKSQTRTSVTPEYRYRIEGFRDRSVARSDIWIEAHARSKSALVVIENKIRASESDRQLSWYEKKARAWCKSRGHTRYLLIFLNKNGDAPVTSATDNWVSLSYLQLASALRTAWLRNRKAPGSAWLAMYISSITRGVLGIDIRRLTDITIDDIETYLGRN